MSDEFEDNGYEKPKRKFFDFYGDLFDLSQIKTVTKEKSWNSQKEYTEYKIIFNKDLGAKYFLPCFIYTYNTEKERDTYLSIIREKLIESGIEILN